MKKEVTNKGIKYRLYIEEFLLLYLLWSDISGFLGVLPADFEYIDKLIAWLVIGLLFYHLSLTRILFGHKNPLEDMVILISFFLLVIKNNFVIIKELVRESIFLTDYFAFMLKNTIIIEKTAFYIAGLLLLSIALYTAKKLSIKKPSIMHLIHEEGKPPKAYSRIFVRFITVFLVLISFFIIIFNLFIEWIGYLQDDAITILSIVLVVVIINKHSSRLSEYRIFMRINNISEKFIDKTFEFLKTKRHIFIASSGILVLHLLTDFIVFIFPLFIGKISISYLGTLEANHPTIFQLAIEDILQASGLDRFYFFYLYTVELIAIIFLMIFPLYIWYLYYCEKEIKINDRIIALFFASLVAYILAPIFKLTSISRGNILGVDIRINPISFAAIAELQYIVLLSMLVFFLTFLAIHYFNFLKKLMIYISFLPLAIFMIRYVYLFLKDLLIFYLKAINNFLLTNEIFFASYFSIFLIITALFYVLGTSYFLFEAEKKLGYFATHFYSDNKVYKRIKNKGKNK